MLYEVRVTIHNSPNKTRGWVYLVTADAKEDAVEDALGFAQAKANKPYSRFKRCTFSVDDNDVRERPDW